MKGIADIQSVGTSVYETPLCIVVEIDSEGVLCLSPGSYHDPIYGDDDPII